MKVTREHERLREAQVAGIAWKKWGPYLSERQWGTVRENVRQQEAWDDLTHDQARSRAYLSGEDGLGGFCDERMLLCCSVGLWNGRDPILKERMFGLTNSEGNHGEDVKEYYFYLDSTPTHSYAKMLYKYPQAAFPYEQILQENRRRSRREFEFELLDTGIFDQDRYWDVFIEYAKEDPEDIHARITIANRGPDTASVHVLPQLWFRNTWWAWPNAPRPRLEIHPHSGTAAMAAHHEQLGDRYFYCENASELLFTENETNTFRLFGQPNTSPYVKDGINDYLVLGQRDAVNPAHTGTKASAHCFVTVGPGQSTTLRLRLTPYGAGQLPEPFGAAFDQTFQDRLREADDFYGELTPPKLDQDAARVLRQSYAGLLWSKQAYLYDVDRWLRVRGLDPETAGDSVRNGHWFHMYNADVISMPDKWEYPWFAAWDLAFHTIPLATVDPQFSAGQLDLMLRDRYQHPNGQLPAYEWNFGDVNPPVHAWAALFNYRLNREALGPEAIPFLKRIFQRLLFNFNWWLNRKDREGRNLFEGGFLGLDNIGVFDRSAPLPTGGFLEQADGTAWMALFAQNMLEMALELALDDPTYEDLAGKFFEHVLRITHATNRVGGQDAMWDEQDGFFYDVLRVPGQFSTRLKVRTLVGLLPLCAVTVYRQEVLERLPNFVARWRWLAEHRPELLTEIHQPAQAGVAGRRMLSLLNEEKLRRVLARMLDPAEFFSDYGIRSVSRHHLEHPYTFHAGGRPYTVSYVPAESDSGMFGGNSNWRGPIWAPINAVILRALLQLYGFYGDDFKIECPTGSRRYVTLFQVAQELSNRLNAILLRNQEGRRPVYGGMTRFQNDPHWRDYIQFHEYFHGDNGAGLGASHQTGWTAIIPALNQLMAHLTPEMILAPDQPLAARRYPERERPGALGLPQ